MKLYNIVFYPFVFVLKHMDAVEMKNIKKFVAGFVLLIALALFYIPGMGSILGSINAWLCLGYFVFLIFNLVWILIDER